MENVLAAVNDNHGYLDVPDEVVELAEALGPDSPSFADASTAQKQYGDFEVAGLAAESFLAEDLTTDSWLLKWGKMENGMGYIQVITMFLYFFIIFVMIMLN